MDERATQIADERDAAPLTPVDGSAEPAEGSGVPAPRSRRPLVAGGLAGLWALAVGVALVTCLVMLAWAVSPNSSGDSAAAWRAAGLTWLGAHLVPLQVSGQPVTLLPLGGLLLGLLLARRSGAWAGRLLPEPTAAEVAWLAIGAGLLYGGGGAAVAWLSAGQSAAAQPGPAAVVTAGVAAVGVLWGIAREAELVDRARSRVSDAAWRTWLAGLASVVGLFAAGALLVAVSLVRHFAEVAGTLADLDPGFVGAAGVTLVDALSLPNLAIWAVAVIAGPGFQLGATGSLSAFGGEVESLPALPVLAVIPTTAPGWAPVLLLVPVLLGVLAGRIRWGRDLPTVGGAAVGALGLGLVVAPLTAAMLRVSTGSLGGDRLAEVGPLLLPVTAAATGLILMGFLGEAAFQSLRLSWDLHRAERRAAGPRGPGGRLEGTDLEGGVAAVAEPGPVQPAAGPAPQAATDPAAVGAPGGAAGTPGLGDPPTTGRRVAGAAAVTRRISGIGASAVSVLPVVSGASGAVVAQAVAIGESARARLGAPVDGTVVDVRERAVDLREEADARDEAAEDLEDGPVEQAEPVEAPAEVTPAPDEHVASDEQPDSDEDPAAEATGLDARVGATAADDTDEIPVVTAAGAPAEGPASPED